MYYSWDTKQTWPQPWWNFCYSRGKQRIHKIFNKSYIKCDIVVSFRGKENTDSGKGELEVRATVLNTGVRVTFLKRWQWKKLKDGERRQLDIWRRAFQVEETTRAKTLRQECVWLKKIPRSPAAAAKSLQLCPTLCEAIDTAHQASLSMGFSRQGYWSGLPFPSPTRESSGIQTAWLGVGHNRRGNGARPWGKSTHKGFELTLSLSNV